MKTIFRFLKFSIGENLVKLIFLILGIILLNNYHVNVNTKYQRVESKILSHFKNDNKFGYVFENNPDKVSYYDKELELKGNIVILNTPSDNVILGIFAGSTMIMMVIIMTLLGIVRNSMSFNDKYDNHYGWNFVKSYYKTKCYEIEVDIEYGEYFYHYKRKLICRSIEEIDKFSLWKKINYLNKNKSSFMDYYPTQKERNLKLGKLLS